MRFANPVFLLLLIPVAVAILWDARRRWSRAHSTIGDGGFFPVRGIRARLAEVFRWSYPLAAILLVVALARPQSGAAKVEITSEGIDIVLALDVSGSMRAEDFKPANRLEVAKRVADTFVEGRQGDRIGLVVFAGGAYTQCPITLDYGMVRSLLAEVDFGRIPDGTAIGLAVATAVNRLRDTRGESRVVILLTDGQNNAGEVDPITAAEAARALGVRVYTIGAGTDGPARIPVDDPVFGRRYQTIEASLDEETLGKIAEITGGRYWRATSAEALESIYAEIDQMERSEAETVEYVQYTENGPWIALAAALLLAGTMLVSEGVASRILTMEFGSPHLLHLIWLVPLFAGLGVIGAGLRSRRLRRWADESLWVPLAPGRSRWRRGVRLSLALIALGFAVLAAARPQVAARLVQVDRQGIEVVVLLDTSLSMEANDVVPSRLERSKLEIRELMDGLEGDKIGLVIFAGTAFPLCPLTADVAGANLFLDAVEVDLLPDPGTNLEAALRGALDMLTRSESTTASAAVVLFSDGESHDGDPFPILEEYNEVGIPILTVGVGTPGGNRSPCGTNGARCPATRRTVPARWCSRVWTKPPSAPWPSAPEDSISRPPCRDARWATC